MSLKNISQKIRMAHAVIESRLGSEKVKKAIEDLWDQHERDKADPEFIIDWAKELLPKADAQEKNELNRIIQSCKDTIADREKN